MGARAASAKKVARVYRANADSVRRRARRLGVPEDAIDDVVHDVFMIVGRMVERGDERCITPKWLFSVTKRVIQTRRRSYVRHARKIDAFGRASAVGTTREDERVKVERQDLLVKLLRCLDVEQRVVFVLTVYGEMSAPEIGRYLGVNPNTVSSRLRAARQRLRRAVASYESKAKRGVAAVALVDLKRFFSTGRAAPTRHNSSPPDVLSAGLSKTMMAWSLAGALGVVVAAKALAGERGGPPASTREASTRNLGAEERRPEIIPSRPDVAPSGSSSPDEEVDSGNASGSGRADKRQDSDGSRGRSMTRGGSRRDAPSGGGFVSEASLLGKAWDALRRGDVIEAKEMVREHEREFANGKLMVERDALTAITICRSDDVEPDGRARAFIERHSNSPYVNSVRTFCGLK